MNFPRYASGQRLGDLDQLMQGQVLPAQVVDRVVLLPDPATPTWGAILSDARSFVSRA
jgi:hypothetical protein